MPNMTDDELRSTLSSLDEEYKKVFKVFEKAEENGDNRVLCEDLNILIFMLRTTKDLVNSILCEDFDD